MDDKDPIVGGVWKPSATWEMLWTVWMGTVYSTSFSNRWLAALVACIRWLHRTAQVHDLGIFGCAMIQTLGEQNVKETHRDHIGSTSRKKVKHIAENT